MLLQPVERDGQVGAAEAEPEVVAGVAEDRSRGDQHALGLEQLLREPSTDARP